MKNEDLKKKKDYTNLKKNIKHLYFYVCMTIIMLGSVLLGFLYFYPVKVMEFKGVVTVDKEVYYPGDSIIYTLSYCKYKSIPGTVYRSLVNSTRTSYTEFTNNLPTGCHTTKVADLHIPEYTDEGLYHLEGSVKYEVNPLRNEIDSWKSVDFIIKK